MVGDSIGDILKSKSKEVDPAFNEIAIFKHLINERKGELDLLRELLSNSGAQEVGATKIEISYTTDKEGHVFEVLDDGCGMGYTGNKDMPGRLDKFLGLGLSGIVGHLSDEFSWKGLGSKLAYQSRRVEVETCQGPPNSFYDVRINEPWDTLNRNLLPKPRLSEHDTQQRGTSIRVIGHPPHHKIEQPYTFDQIKAYLQHRTFVGFTRKRINPPAITLSILGKTEQLEFGFPEFRTIEFQEFAHQGFKLDESTGTLYVHVEPKSSKGLPVVIKGFLTWDPDLFDLANESLNTGLILSVKGIPYFLLDMEEFGVTTIRVGRPGKEKTCLVVECDAIHNHLNISRSGLIDSPETVEFRKAVSELFQRIETSKEYLEFRTIPEKRKTIISADALAKEKQSIESADQNWVVLEKEGRLTVLIREPQSEQEVNAVLWKLEASKALPFEKFETLAYIGAARGPDLLVHFQEDRGSEPHRATVIEVENNFYNYKTHGHKPPQYPKVICWDIPPSGRKAKINKTSKPFKFTVNMDEYQVHIFVLKNMEGIRVMSRVELKEKGIAI
jgi:hypothetical protein